jgi:hypothetical protein
MKKSILTDNATISTDQVIITIQNIPVLKPHVNQPKFKS